MPDEKTVRIHILHCGTIRVSPSVAIDKETDIKKLPGYMLTPDRDRVTLPVSVYLIEHPRGLILVDTGFLEKDSSRNMARVFADGPENMQPVSETARRIETGIRPVRSWTDRSGTQLSLLEIHLITGRSHQIRAHLSSIGHPIIGDVKYGNASLNRRYLSECGVQSQLLHAYRLTFPNRVDEPLSGLSGKVVTADPPPAFLRTGRMNCGR